MGRLSTHVLDTAQRQARQRASPSSFSPSRARAAARSCTTVTNADGRTDAPLMIGDGFPSGNLRTRLPRRRLFPRSETAAADPPFLDMVPIRFTIAEPDGHYHVPLLVSPWSYSTYRGS